MNTAGHSEATVRRGLELTPFRGLRYDPDRVGSLAAVTSPPYDVVVRPDGLHHLEAADPHNIVRLILPQAATPAERNEQAADTLRRWLADGVLTADPEPGLYVYEQQDGAGLLQRGIIGALRVSEPSESVVLPHEDVMPHVVADRAALMRATEANLEPLLLTYRGDGSTADTTAVIERIADLPPLLATTTEDGYHHRLWSVTAPADVAAIQADLGRHQALIADGHHRWATYRRLRAEHASPSPWDYGLVLLVDTARYPLRVRAIHRLLHGLPVADALAALDGLFRVRHLDAPLAEALTALGDAAQDGNAYLLAGDGGYHLVDRPDPALLARTVPAGRPEAWRSLDATVLHATLLDHVWRIPEDSPAHIAYIHDAAATVAKAERDAGTAVLMHPVREEVVRDLARQGVTMPRKSTSFGPKPASGLVLRVLDI
ncbi:chromosome partitioning protein ParA [Streptomyces pharetrae CZA14]|uniref:Chromosome partitioning protein ParA n=1 Tax=Streptomyces pharetrae CZA14 TaxID=1144883 RepID=A0ABX3YD93_9ACTN|nr:chromosome partitioning protein ParA [Streptomyces pharetrae CZA14]